MGAYIGGMGEPKKPWMEEWSLKGARIETPGNDATFGELETWVECCGAGACISSNAEDEARAKLAAAAPDLYRALATVEWSGTIDGGLTCPTCEATGGGRHEPDCALNAALRKARGE